MSEQEIERPLIKLAATEVVSGVSGETEEKIRELFQLATVSLVILCVTISSNL